ncbi:type IV pilus modification protein PilV [Pseudomonas sp. AA-38]|uniref:type IV pilus modification protein PilV n=1 Tax=Pseudomonas sp. AA-38 TaxID=3028807 RepID=UPI0023F667AB|nr:type IV pilus modification protein PilV [Pseudomonas sp. AA-38]
MYRPLSSSQRGFTLIEVMVAVVILAVGLLGMASLMARSQKSNEGAYARGQATLMAYDIVERMRANIVDPASSDKKYKVLFVTQSSSNAAEYALSSLPDCTAPTGAVPAGGESRASYDIASWCASLKSSLPSVDAANTKISFDTSKLDTLGTAMVTVRIQWQDNSKDGSQSQYVEVVTSL